MKKTALICFLHGNEGYGLKVCKTQTLFPFFIGNPLAVEKKVRFVDVDMNRCFPGKKNGKTEERFAFELLEKLKNFDFVIDLHSTSNSCPIFGIITQPSKEKIEFAKKMGLKKLVIMPEHFASGKALIDFVKCGISLEVGPHNRKESVSETLNLLDNLSEDKNYNEKLEIYEVKKIIEKRATNILIKNFDFVKKGDSIAVDNEFVQKAEKDFFAILVGEESYKDILCLAAERIN